MTNFDWTLDLILILVAKRGELVSLASKLSIGTVYHTWPLVDTTTGQDCNNGIIEINKASLPMMAVDTMY